MLSKNWQERDRQRGRGTSQEMRASFTPMIPASLFQEESLKKCGEKDVGIRKRHKASHHRIKIREASSTEANQNTRKEEGKRNPRNSIQKLDSLPAPGKRRNLRQGTESRRLKNNL